MCRSLAVLLLPLALHAMRAPLDKPNIVMFFVDDLGYGDTNFNGHPTTSTPNIDQLAYGGKVLSTWYSGCPVCSGSRAALMTGRQYTRVGVPGVFGPTGNTGLPLNETTVANQLKKADYSTAAMGKWHLGQRSMFLPAARGFDRYLGIPYSDDMGTGVQTPCGNSSQAEGSWKLENKGADVRLSWDDYVDHGYVQPSEIGASLRGDPAGSHLPLVHQETAADGTVNTTILEQPLDFTTLAIKYKNFVTGFISEHGAHGDKADKPFFLYMPFSHVHTTDGVNTPEKQYASCAYANTSRRGKFGDALSEVDWIIGEVSKTLKSNKLEENTLIMFTGDNGPWMVQGKSGGSPGLLIGRYSGYWNVGKGSTWEGGVREAGFAYWPGQIEPFSRTAEIVSSLDLLPTASALAGVPLPTDRVYDGRDATDVLLNKNGGKSKHEVLFLYGGAGAKEKGPSAARYGRYKVHWATGPGLSGCANCSTIQYPDPPLMFDVEEDPSEAYPLYDPLQGGKARIPAELQPVVDAVQAAYATERATFTWGKLVAPPDLPGEGPNKYGVCCDRSLDCDCSTY